MITHLITFRVYERLRVMVFNATFNNISVISWRSVLLVEERGVSAASHWQTLSHNAVSSTPRLSGIQTHSDSSTFWRVVPHSGESHISISLELNCLFIKAFIYSTNKVKGVGINFPFLLITINAGVV